MPGDRKALNTKLLQEGQSISYQPEGKMEPSCGVVWNAHKSLGIISGGNWQQIILMKTVSALPHIKGSSSRFKLLLQSFCELWFPFPSLCSLKDDSLESKLLLCSPEIDYWAAALCTLEPQSAIHNVQNLVLRNTPWVFFQVLQYRTACSSAAEEWQQENKYGTSECPFLCLSPTKLNTEVK